MPEQLISRRQLLALAAAASAAPVALAAARTPRYDFQRLRARLKGPLLTPSTPDYDQARKTFSFNPRTDRHPAAIAYCADEADILHCLEFAELQRLQLAVRSGGHDVLAASTCDNGLVIDVSAMKHLGLGSGDVLTVGAGTKSGAINSFLQTYDRAVPLGDAESVGVAGLTLGGGLGWLLGRHGAACDNLKRVRMITADGRVLTVSEHEHPDLFWAIRGGGGNFGIATEFEFVTHPVGHVLGGKLVYDASKVADFLRFFADYRRSAPDELTAELSITGGDRRIIVVTVCCLGTASFAERAVQPLLTKFVPIVNGLTRRPYDQINDPGATVGKVLQQHSAKLGTPSKPSFGIHWLGGTIGELSDAAADAIDRQTRLARGGWSFGLGHHMQGAVSAVPATATALPRRAGSYCYHFDSWWIDAEQAPTQMAWTDASMAALAAHSIPTYINYLSDDREAAVRRAYGDKFHRLLQLKKRYDPQNILHRNRNIR